MTLSTGFSMPERKEYPVLPDDIYEVKIRELKDEEQSVYQKPDEKEMVIRFTFEVTEEGPYKGQYVWKRARPNFFIGSNNGQPSTLYAIWKAVNGKTLTQEEADELGPDGINALEGARLRIHVIQKPRKDGGMRNDVSDFLSLKKVAQNPQRMTEDGIPIIDEDEEKEVDPKEIPF